MQDDAGPAGSQGEGTGPFLGRRATAADPRFRTAAIACGLLAALAAFLGLAGARLNITLLASIYPGARTIALSAALIWMVVGIILAANAARPLRGRTALAAGIILVLITAVEAVELPLNLLGAHSPPELLLTAIGTGLIGPLSAPISPVASILILVTAVALFLLLELPASPGREGRVRDIAGIAGSIVAVAGFTFALSYVFGDPLLYGTGIIPIAAVSALCALFTGVALAAAAGPAAAPLKYLAGRSMQARLTRIFVPLVIAIVLVENILFSLMQARLHLNDALQLSVSIVVFAAATVVVVSEVSALLGRALDQAEAELQQKNEELGAMNEELTASGEELRQANDELLAGEKALRESQQENALLAGLLHRSSQPFGIQTVDGKITMVNPAFEELTGYPAAELMGLDPNVSLTPPGWHETDRVRLEGLLKTGTPVRYEKEYLRKDGTRVPVELLVHLVRGEGGRPDLFYSFVTDISERKRAGDELQRKNEELNAINEELVAVQEELRRNIEELGRSGRALRETGTYLENLITYANAPIIVWDRELRITRFNHAFELLTGRTAGDVLGERLEILFPRQYVHEAMDLIRRAMTGERLNVVEIPILHRSGDVRIVLWNSATLYETDGTTVLSTIAQGQDITVRKRAEAELLQKNEELVALNEEMTATAEELQQSNEELGRSERELREALDEKEVLLAEIHHRVKNNLTAFISLLSLEGSYEETEAGQALKNDLQNRARSMALIHETLYRTKKYSHVDMGVYLGTLLDQIAGSYISPNPVEVKVDAGGVVLDLARATPCGLIINELVTNSFKYAFPEEFDCRLVRKAACTIYVLLRQDDEDYILTVRDNGRGLPEGFDALHARSLGLKLVNFLARHQLRGTVGIHSGGGTEFTVRFPVDPRQRRRG